MSLSENIGLKEIRKYIQPLLAGCLFPLAFAPISLPGFGVISLAWFFYLLSNTSNNKNSKKTAFIQGLFFGMGFFGVGVSWVFISIHSYGQAPWWLAFILTVLFCMFMALYTASFAWTFAWISRRRKTQKFLQQSIIFSVLWVIFEYIRANLFTGFPWLLLGFSQTETPMRYLAPIMGVYGLSFLVAFSSCLLTRIFCFPNNKTDINLRKGILPALGLIMIYLLPQLLSPIHWTHSHQKPVPISVIQGNIAEDEKWLPGAFQKTIERYMRLTKKIPEGRKIIVWPEGAVPIPYPQGQAFLANLSDFIRKDNAVLVTGIPYENPKKANQYYNAIMVLGNNRGQYFKHHLVPFGEYLPSPVFNYITDYFGMPIYEMARGKKQQPLLMIHDIPTLPFICYEIAYADILLKSLPETKLLITISDDAWFGHSLARAQHLQMAEMRSLQSGRYQIVATNNGISAVINERGRVIATIPSFRAGILNSYIQVMSGSTPWSYLGDNAVLIFFCILLCCIIVSGYFYKQK